MTNTTKFYCINKTGEIVSAIRLDTGECWTLVGDLVITPTGGHCPSHLASFEATKDFLAFVGTL